MEFKKLGRKQLLGLMTAGAIVVSTVGSFAAWDQLSATATGGSVTFDQVAVSAAIMDENTFVETARTYGADELPTYTGSVKFNVVGVPEDKTAELTLTPVLKDGETVIDSSTYTATVTTNGGTDALQDNKDVLTAGAVVGDHEYTIVIKPKVENVAALANKTLSVEVKAELSAPKAP